LLLPLRPPFLLPRSCRRRPRRRLPLFLSRLAWLSLAVSALSPSALSAAAVSARALSSLLSLAAGLAFCGRLRTAGFSASLAAAFFLGAAGFAGFSTGADAVDSG